MNQSLIMLAEVSQDFRDRHLAVPAGGANRLDQPLVAPPLERGLTNADRARHLFGGDKIEVPFHTSTARRLRVNALNEL